MESKMAQVWTMRAGRFVISVTDAEDASRNFRALQRVEEERTAWARTLRGARIFEGAKQIAYVSQNGKVWEGLESRWKVDAVPAFNPYGSAELSEGS